MIEAEKKIPLSASAKIAVLDFAQANNISFTEPDQEVDKYYRPAGFRSRVQSKSDYLVRIRRATSKTTLNLKMLTANAGIIIEHETSLGDADVGQAIIELMGAEYACTVTKARRRGTYDGVDLLLDDVVELGSFLEVAVDVAEGGDANNAMRRVDEFLRRVGIDPQQAETRGYPDIILEAQGVRY